VHLNIRHVTRYAYERPLSYGLQELRLTPRTGPGQRVLDWRMTVAGGRVEVEFDDQHMNRVTLISFAGDGHEIVVTAAGAVETADLHGILGRHQGFAPLWLFLRQTELTRAGPHVRRLLRGLEPEPAEPLARLHRLSERVRAAVAYAVGATDAATSAEAALERGAGVCQDHAHVFLAAARAMGFPARYVSGYLMIEGRDEQEASHAWAEAHLDNLGWVGFDVANGISPDARYVRVATGLDYREAAPVSGLRFGDHGRETLAVEIQVQQ
jgi:transglutaminase-like putative cysteine protease